MKTYIGIDPGKGGAMAVLHEDGGCQSNIEIHDGNDIMELDLSPNVEVFACIEKAQAMPKQGTVSMFNYGVTYGACLGMLKALCIPYQEIHPMKWKKEFSLVHQDKQASIDMAKKLFPHIAFLFNRKGDQPEPETPGPLFGGSIEEDQPESQKISTGGG